MDERIFVLLDKDSKITRLYKTSDPTGSHESQDSMREIKAGIPVWVSKVITESDMLPLAPIPSTVHN